MRTTVEQLTRRRRPGRGSRRLEKRFAAKLMRRLGRVLLDEAPRRLSFYGWWD